MHAKVFAEALKASWSHENFADAARIAYTTTPEEVRDLRDTVADTLEAYPSLLDRDGVRTMVCNISGLAFELLRKARGLPAVVDQKSSEEGLVCADCGNEMDFIDCGNCRREFQKCCQNMCPHCGMLYH